jgi:hypothetical protein
MAPGYQNAVPVIVSQEIASHTALLATVGRQDFAEGGTVSTVGVSIDSWLVAASADPVP